MANFFSSDWFLAAAASILAVGRGCRPCTVEVDGQCFRTLLDRDGRVVQPALVDFHAPVPRPAEGAVPATFIPRVALRARPADPGAALPAGTAPAPYIDWSCHPTWRDFVQTCKARNSRAFRRSPARLRRLARDLGEVVFRADVRDHALLERLLLWKSRQLRRTGGLDRFCSMRTRQLLHHLLHAGHLRLACLSAGGEVLAALLHHESTEGVRCWISAYGPRFSCYAPGILLFEQLMEHSFQQGHARFDFLIGGEAYKYHYATHERLVRPIGRQDGVRRTLGRLRDALDRETVGREDELRRRLRRAGVAGVQRWIGRSALVDVRADPFLPHYRHEIEQNQRSWPRARIRRPGDCQLQVLIAQADADAGPLRVRAYQAQHAARRVRGLLHRGAVPPWRRGARPPPKRPEPLGLQAGERVRVRSVDEIRATLEDRRCQGLYYIPEVMDRHAGGIYVVDRPVRRFYDERSRAIRQARHAVLLRDVLCDGSQIHDDRGCGRGCPVFWHEAWLERVDAAAAPPSSRPPAETAAPSAARGGGPSRRAAEGLAPGQRVRIRSLDELRDRPAPPGSGVAMVPEIMARFAGQVHTVRSTLEVAYDERLGRVFHVDHAVVLEGAHCPGVELTDGGRCDRRCALFWRPEWLEVVGGADSGRAAEPASEDAGEGAPPRAGTG